MAAALVSNTKVAGTGSTGTTPSINTTGATFLVAIIGDQSGGVAPVMSDSKSNTWINRTSYSTSVASRSTIAYVNNPTVGTGHTFTITSAGNFPSICVAAFSGTEIVSVYDVENGSFTNGATSLQPGSITPSGNNYLVISGNGFNGTQTLSINSSFTITDQQQYGAGNNYGTALAYLVQGAAAAVNPTWSWGSSNFAAASIASFKVPVVASTTKALAALGVG